MNLLDRNFTFRLVSSLPSTVGLFSGTVVLGPRFRTRDHHSYVSVQLRLPP